MTEHPVQKVYDDLVKYLHVYMVQRMLPAREIHEVRFAEGDEGVKDYIEYNERRVLDSLVNNVIEESHETDIVGGVLDKSEHNMSVIHIRAGITIAHRDFHKRLKEAIKDAYERGVQYGRAILR